MNSSNLGKLIVISGPSGVGKSSVVRCLLDNCDLPLELSVSATTRQPRTGEQDGVDYWFLSDKEFLKKRNNGEFLESAEVFGRGDWYGTLNAPVEKMIHDGKIVILEIDVAGAMQVVEKYPSAVTIFIHPGSLKELEKRLRGRETEDDDDVKERLAVAQAELELAPQYNYIVENIDIQSTADRICGLLSTLGERNSCTTN